MNYCADPFYWQRRRTREVKVGSVGVGGENPIRIQTMLISDTMNTDACVREAIPIIEAGCEILRITAPSINDAKNLKNIVAELHKREYNTPIVADIHFVPAAALEAAEWCEKVRINPGNYADRKKFAVREYTDDQYSEELDRLEKAFAPLVLKCKQLGRAMRIGTNHGSLSDRIMNRYGDTPLGMVESALEFVRVCRKHDYHDIILSMKASNPKVMVEAYRMLVARLDAEGPDWNYPLHLGVTEAGEGEDGRIKSAIGIGALLEDGIGDTVRVSLTEDSVHEIPVCRELVRKYIALWEQQQTGKLPERPVIHVTEKRSPYSYLRRQTPEYFIGALRLRLGKDHPPRVEVPVPVTATVAQIQRITTAEPDTFAEILQFHVKTMADIGKIATLRPRLREYHIETPIAVRLDSADVTLPVVDVAEKINVPFAGKEDVTAVLDDATNLTVQFDIEADSPAEFENNCATLAGVLNLYSRSQVILAVGRAEGLDVIAAYRVLAAVLDQRGLVLPILLRDRVSSQRGHHAQQNALIAASTHIGSLLCDGLGDAVEITGEDDLLKSVKLAYNILQAAGSRTFKTDYVACPSCGRTLFDLQTVTARIKSRTAHLKGVKIAVMGCIVNGPGEMADADFGYVGTAPGKISLWVGKKQVKQHIPENQAVDELIALIREHGKWINPPAAGEEKKEELALSAH
ncbi:MAG TPA: (E)-4-hydroxy-3-methylbut-2-enyl-diphosphate synthase [Verrucomicrobiae bacterium]|nr:(E)-4-hydroxy-3-methylbut-2-enyl-diphosphate synthase [Verrucomicrobiae bacterium]